MKKYRWLYVTIMILCFFAVTSLFWIRLPDSDKKQEEEKSSSAPGPNAQAQPDDEYIEEEIWPELIVSTSDPGFISPDIASPASVAWPKSQHPDHLLPGQRVPSPYPPGPYGAWTRLALNVDELVKYGMTLYKRSVRPPYNIVRGPLNDHYDLELIYTHPAVGARSNFVLRFVPKSETTPTEAWDPLVNLLPYIRYRDFKSVLPSESRLSFGFTPEDNKKLLAVLDAFWPIPFSLKEEIVNIVREFYINPNVKDAQERILFQWFMEGYGHMPWGVIIAPNYIACYTDGGIYDLTSPDMANSLLEEKAEPFVPPEIAAPVEDVQFFLPPIAGKPPDLLLWNRARKALDAIQSKGFTTVDPGVKPYYMRDYGRYAMAIAFRFPRSWHQSVHYVIKIDFHSPEPNNSFILSGDRFFQNMIPSSWGQLKQSLPARLPDWAGFRRTLFPGYEKTLSQDISEMLKPLPLSISMQKEIVEAFEAFHHRQDQKIPGVQERFFFSERFSGAATSATYPLSAWRVLIAPDYIACFSDGERYRLLSSDVATR